MKIKEHGRQINQDLMWVFKLSCITAGFILYEISFH